MNKPVELLDSIMGSGKSTGIIRWMLSNPQYKYLYVSPMLTEVEDRIPEQCEALGFVCPSAEEHDTKSEHLLKLLKDGCNVSFTHKLFTDMTKEHLKYIEKNNYVLIVDEEIAMIEHYSGRYNKGDILSLEKAGHVVVHEDQLGRVEWKWDNMEDKTVYTRLRNLCEMDMLYCTKRDRDILVTQLPMALLQVAQRTILLTYMFEGSVMEAFLKLRNIPVVHFTAVALLKNTETVLSDARQLINFFHTTKTKEVSKYSLSYGWYTKSATKDQLSAVANALFSVFRKYKEEDILFTTPKGVLINDKGETPKRNIRHKRVHIEDTYLHSSARATNLYSHKKVLVHAYNRYANIPVKAYLQDYGCPPDDDKYALSEMVQWIWRSQIRNGLPIELCIVSTRMEKLFKTWLGVK